MEEEAETIPTGFTDLDEALGIGGLPCGRISELFGADSSGKQALAAAIAVQCQKQEGIVAWIDPAGRLDPEQTRALGVSPDALLVARPRNDLEALEMAVRLARSGGVKLLVFDLMGDRRWEIGDREGQEGRERREGRGTDLTTGLADSVGRAACPPPRPAGRNRWCADRPGGETLPLRVGQPVPPAAVPGRAYASRPYRSDLPVAAVDGADAAGDEPPALRDAGFALHPSHFPPSLPRSLAPSLNLALRRLVAAVHKNRIAFLFITESADSRQLSAISHQSSVVLTPTLSLWEREHYPLRTQNPELRTEYRAQHSALRTQRPAPTQHSALSTQHSKGGQALRYFASVRLEIERREWIRRGREVVGCRSAVRVVKNKLAAPHREAEVELWFYLWPVLCQTN